MSKLTNPSENHRNTPVDEYSENGDFDMGSQGTGAQSDRNHYFTKSKIEVSHEAAPRPKAKSRIGKYSG